MLLSAILTFYIDLLCICSDKQESHQKYFGGHLFHFHQTARQISRINSLLYFTQAQDNASVFKKITKHWIDLVLEMARLIEKQRICSSTRERIDDHGHKTTIRCTKREGFHGSSHQNPTKFYGSEESMSTLQKMFYRFVSVFGFGYPAGIQFGQHIL